MMKSEFEQLIDNSVSNEDYTVIETVYMWHPSISNTDGKCQITRLYTDYGMTVIRDMLPRAQQMLLLDGELRQAQYVLDGIRERIEELER